jgi:hypothetical protein
MALDICSAHGTGHEVIIPEKDQFSLLFRVERSPFCPQNKVKRLTFFRDDSMPGSPF